MSERVDFGLVSKDKVIIEATGAICREFSFTRKIWSSVSDFFESSQDCRLIMYSALEEKDHLTLEKDLIEFTQLANQVCSNVYIMGLVPKKVPKEKVEFLKKSGINTLIIKSELEESSKLGFMASQAIRAEYIPIKESDLIPGARLTFDIYHLLPLRKKFLKLIREGTVLEDSKIEKLRSVGEFYIAREHVDRLKKYIIDHPVESSTSHQKKCRAFFLDFNVKFLEMVNTLSDQSLTLSFDEGKTLMQETLAMANQLCQVLTTVEPQDIWGVINNSVIGEFGSLERSPAISAYVAYFGTLLGLENIDDLIFSALLADLGMINLPSNVTKKIRQGNMNTFTAEEKSQYRSYPTRTLEILANRRLPIEQNIRDWISLSRETADGKGFPNKARAENLSFESQLLYFSFIFDSQTTLKLGEARKDRMEILAEIIREEDDRPTKFTAAFVLELRKALTPFLPDDLKVKIL